MPTITAVPSTTSSAPATITPTLNRRLLALLVIVWIVALTVLVLGATHRIPRPDEGHFSSPAYNLSHFGFPGTTTVDPDASGLLRIDKRTYWTMPLYMLAEAAWFLVFPATILSARLLTIVLLIPVGWQLYRIVESLTNDRRTALIAATLLPADYAFMYAAVSARPDVLCLLFGLSAIASYLRLRSVSLLKALAVANFWLALSALSHPNALLHLAAFAALVLIYDRHRFTWRMFAAVACVYLLMMTPWLIYASVDFEAFMAQMRANGANNGRVTQTLNPPSLFTGELSRYASAYGLDSHQLLPKLKSWTLVLYIAALFVTWRIRMRPGIKTLLLLWLAYFGVQTVFNQKLSVYLVHILPLYSALLAAAAVFVWHRYPRIRFAVPVALGVSVLIQCGGMFWTSRQHTEVEQAAAASFLRSHATRAAVINGSSTLVYALGFDRRLTEDHALGLTTGKQPDVIVTDDNYTESFALMASRRPELYAKVHTRLTTYPVVFRNAEFQVRFSPAFCAASAGAVCAGSTSVPSR